MKQYELSIRIAQIHHLLNERKYKKALTVVRALDLKQVKSTSDLSVIADVFAKTEQFESAKETYLKIYNKSKTKRIVQRLIYISIRTKDIAEAEKYYSEFLEMNPSSRDVITSRYRIDKAAGVPIGKLIETLEELKEEEYIEEWAYELAKLYHKAGRFEESRRECEEIKLWFGHGEIVDRAKKIIDCIDIKDAALYIDDKDYTIDKGEPNPDDTGSLPGLDEYIGTKSQKNISKEKKSVIDDYQEDDFYADTGLGKRALEGLSKFFKFGSRKSDANRRKIQESDIDVDDDKEKSTGISHDIVTGSKGDIDVAFDNDLYNKFVNSKKDTAKKDNTDVDASKESLEYSKNEKSEVSADKSPSVPVYSQSGTGITQDLSREISAIYEAEQREQEQVKEKGLKTEYIPLQKDTTNVIERMTKAVKNDESKNVQFVDTEETVSNTTVESDLKDVQEEIADDLNDEAKDSDCYEAENDTFYDDVEYDEEESDLDEGDILSDDDLPTTKALHASFDDVLTLIGGEKDPAHFVFIGDTSELLVGLSKRIVKVMKEKGFMSIGRIAKTNAKKFNRMEDLDDFKSKLKGNCLLIQEASKLIFPAIANVFDMMDEFYGDFVVILADNGKTLDQLFKFAPTLAKRFQYIIDISQYTEEDCE